MNTEELAKHIYGNREGLYYHRPTEMVAARLGWLVVEMDLPFMADDPDFKTAKFSLLSEWEVQDF